jgi:hypothetical protein
LHYYAVGYRKRKISDRCDSAQRASVNERHADSVCKIVEMALIDCLSDQGHLNVNWNILLLLRSLINIPAYALGVEETFRHII